MFVVSLFTLENKKQLGDPWTEVYMSKLRYICTAEEQAAAANHIFRKRLLTRKNVQATKLCIVYSHVKKKLDYICIYLNRKQYIYIFIVSVNCEITGEICFEIGSH
jgi:hypothetical protein